jgi:hypothetical protein
VPCTTKILNGVDWGHDPPAQKNSKIASASHLVIDVFATLEVTMDFGFGDESSAEEACFGDSCPVSNLVLSDAGNWS